MAERRMFSKRVINNDTFLDMPATARAFYYHLAMMADDDGFVNNTRSTMRSVNSTNEDIQTLIDKGFIIYFEAEGISVIRHWKISNNIRKDLYTETKHKKLKARLSFDHDGAYTLQYRNEPVTEPLQYRNEPVTEPLQDRNEPVTEPLQYRNEPVTEPLQDRNEPGTEPLQDRNEPGTLVLDQALVIDQDQDQEREREKDTDSGPPLSSDNTFTGIQSEAKQNIVSRIEHHRQHWASCGLPPAKIVTNADELSRIKPTLDSFTTEKIDEAITNFKAVISLPDFSPAFLPGDIAQIPNFKNFMIRWVDRFTNEAKPFEAYSQKTREKTRARSPPGKGPDWGGAVAMGKPVKARKFFDEGGE